jgi:Fibronectin type III domain
VSAGRTVRAIAGLTLALGACRLGDLVSTPQSAPSAPADLTQHAGNDASAIGPGSAVHDSIVILSGLVADPDAADSLRLQVEVEPLGTAFGDSATAASAVVGNETVASVAVTGLAENGAYRWQARTVDPTGRTSGWTPFGSAAGQADFLVDAVADPPAAPDSLAQLRADGVTVIPTGGNTGDTIMVFQARLTDPDAGDSVRLLIEREPVDTAFTGVASDTSAPVAAGRTASVTVHGGLNSTSYHWRALALDRTGLASSWVSFGGNPESQADYVITYATPPHAPSGLGQYEHQNTAIAPGGTTTQTTVTFKATVDDPDGDLVRLEVEVQPLGTDFTGLATAASSLSAGGGQQQASVSVANLVSGKDYHWQVRAVDQAGQASSWVPFGDGITPDFHVQ